MQPNDIYKVIWYDWYKLLRFLKVVGSLKNKLLPVSNFIALARQGKSPRSVKRWGSNPERNFSRLYQ